MRGKKLGDLKWQFECRRRGPHGCSKEFFPMNNSIYAADLYFYTNR